MRHRLGICLLIITPLQTWAATVTADAADAYYDPAAMARARAVSKHHHGDGVVWLVQGERLEHQRADGDGVSVWQAQGWVGGDINKLWWKTEGEHAAGDIEELELHVLFSRAVAPFWDLQAGFRHDVEPGDARTFAALGAQGMAPYWLEVDAAAFLSDDGDLSLRLELEYELRLRQRLMLQPRLELNASFSDAPDAGAGSGLGTLEAGLRLRYELEPGLGPYVGLSWSRAFGDTADLVRAAGGDEDALALVVGFRFWF